MPNKEFLEKYPLYKRLYTDTKYPLHIGLPANQAPKPAIHMPCLVCKSEQTFNMENEYTHQYINEDLLDQVRGLRYRCSACRSGQRIFTIYFGRSTNNELILEKVGQFPAWSIDIDLKIEKSLGEDLASYYKRGLVCESQGYGVGAFAYYRRIVEVKIDQLIEDIAGLIPEGDVEKYQTALASVRAEQQASQKIKIIKNLLPSSLKPDGINPLGVIHSALSEGLHAETDENCLEYAEEIRECLVYLLNEVTKKRLDQTQFTASMKKLLNKRAGQGKSGEDE